MFSKHQTPKVMALLLLSSLFTTPALADTSLGCYSSIPSSYESQGEYQYQSSSWCSGLCADYTFFALTDGSTCYCGNEAPSGSTSDSCNVVCNGYGSEKCGGTDAYTFWAVANNYVLSDSSASAAESSADETTTEATTTASSTSSTTTKAASTQESSATTTTDQSSTKSAVSTQSSGGTTVVIFSTVAVDPTTTATATSTISASSSSATSSASSEHKGTSKGAVIGAAVGGVAGGVALIAVAVFAFLWFRRRNEKEQRDAELADSAYFGAMKRDNSQLGRPLSNPFMNKDEDMVDQRLNPIMLGRRRISEGSLADEADYSRKILRVANPDDED